MNTLQHCRYWYHIFVRLSVCLFLTSVRCQNTWVFFAEYVYTTWKGSGLVAKKTKGNYSLQLCIIISKMIRKSAVFYKYLALSQKPPIVVYACRVPCSLLNDVVFSDLDDLIHSVICIIAALDLEMIFSMIALILLLSIVFQCVLLKFPHLINPG